MPIGVQSARRPTPEDSTLDPAELKQLLRASFFAPSDDPESDSHETQNAGFEEDAMHIAVKLLLASEDEARKHTIAEAERDGLVCE